MHSIQFVKCACVYTVFMRVHGVHVCVCVCVCMTTCACVDMCNAQPLIHTYRMYACMYECMCVCVHVCVYICVYVCVYVCAKCGAGGCFAVMSGMRTTVWWKSASMPFTTDGPTPLFSSVRYCLLPVKRDTAVLRP